MRCLMPAAPCYAVATGEGPLMPDFASHCAILPLGEIRAIGSKRRHTGPIADFDGLTVAMPNSADRENSVIFLIRRLFITLMAIPFSRVILLMMRRAA